MPHAPFRAVYHIATLNHWRSILSEQLAALFNNQNLASLHITLASNSPPNTLAALNLLTTTILSARSHLPVNIVPFPLDQYEFPAMNLIDQLAAAGDSPILYFHMKGVTDNPPSLLWEAWRHHLSRFIAQADHWADFLAANPYDACGTCLLTRPNHGCAFFAGNVWIAAAPYLRSLPPFSHFAQHAHIADFPPNSRYLAELAVNRANTMRPFATDGTALDSLSIWTFLKGLPSAPPP